MSYFSGYAAADRLTVAAKIFGKIFEKRHRLRTLRQARENPREGCGAYRGRTGRLQVSPAGAKLQENRAKRRNILLRQFV
jgi:hypothetical protein